MHQARLDAEERKQASTNSKCHSMSVILKGSLLFAFLGAALAAEDVTSADDAPHADGPTPAGEDAGHESSHELHAANAILFLFVALTVGIILRRAVAGFIIPYTGLLVVSFSLQQLTFVTFESMWPFSKIKILHVSDILNPVDPPSRPVSHTSVCMSRARCHARAWRHSLSRRQNAHTWDLRRHRLFCRSPG